MIKMMRMVIVVGPRRVPTLLWLSSSSSPPPVSKPISIKTSIFSWFVHHIQHIIHRRKEDSARVHLVMTKTMTKTHTKTNTKTKTITFSASSMQQQCSPTALSVHHQCIISASSVHYKRIISASSVHHQCIFSASSVQHQRIISASSVHHQCLISTSSYQCIIRSSPVLHCFAFIAELSPVYCCLVYTTFHN